MSGNIPPFCHQNGIPYFLQSSTTPPPIFSGHYGQTAPTPTPEQIQELANSTAQELVNSINLHQGIPMEVTLTEKELKEKGGIVKAANIYTTDQHHQPPSSMIMKITDNINEVKGVNLYGTPEGLDKVLSAIGRLN